MLSDDAHLSPIPVEEDVISLSAILLDDDYFEALQEARRVVEDISLVDQRLLIPLKARAFLDLSRRKANGEDVDARHIRKHRDDVFRLVQLLPGDGELVLAHPLRTDLGEFLQQALSDPTLDYAALNLPIPLIESTAILVRYYQIDASG